MTLELFVAPSQMLSKGKRNNWESFRNDDKGEAELGIVSIVQAGGERVVVGKFVSDSVG